MYRMIPDNQVAAFRNYIASGQPLPSPRKGGVLAYDAEGAFDIKLTPERRRQMRAYDEEEFADKPDTEVGTDDENEKMTEERIKFGNSDDILTDHAQHAELIAFLRKIGLSDDLIVKACVLASESVASAMDNPPDLPLGGVPTTGGGMLTKLKSNVEPMTARDAAMRQARRIKAAPGYSPNTTARVARDSAKGSTFKPSALVQAIAQRIRIV